VNKYVTVMYIRPGWTMSCMVFKDNYNWIGRKVLSCHVFHGQIKICKSWWI